MRKCICIRCMSAFALFLLVGCSKGPELVPATGTIKIKGQPAANIAIQFLPDVKESTEGVWPTSTAISGEDGSFELRTADNQLGAVPGTHKLVLVDAAQERAEQDKPVKPGRIDSTYSIPGTLKATVEPGKPIEINIP